MIEMFIAHRLIATGVVKSNNKATQKSFDKSYEADIAQIIRKVLREEGLINE